MPLDDRLREAMDREAGALRPDVEEHLRRVRGRSRPSGHRLRTTLAAAAVLIVAAVGLRLSDLDPRALVEPLFGQDPLESPSPEGIAGTYRAGLDGEGAVVGARSFAGEWVLTLGSDSSMSLVPPTGLEGVGGRLTDAVYAVMGDRLVTTLFASEFSRACAGVGTYRWEARHDRLHLDTVDDMCPERVLVLTSAEWMRVAE